MFSFGELAKNTKIDNVRNKQRSENLASMKNRRLAAQMTKRMGGIEDDSSSKGTVKSRLSIPVANRLGTKRGGQVRGRGGVKTRGQRGGGRRGSVTPRGSRGGQTRGRGGLGTRGGGTTRGGGMTRGVRTTRGGGTTRGGRGGLRGARGRQTTRGRGRQTNQQDNSVTRGGRGRGRGGRGANKKPPTKEQLDSELDNYMSKTKSVLNSQLDEYMKGSD